MNPKPKPQNVPHRQQRHRPNPQQNDWQETPQTERKEQQTAHRPLENPTLHVRPIPLEQIVPNPHQPRRHFEEAALQELTDSIRQHGVL